MAEAIPFPINSNPVGLDQSSFPFKVWADSEYNQEKWDAGKGKGKDKSKSPEGSPKLESLFEDPQEVYLPCSIAPELCIWKRPPEIFFDKELVVFVNTADYPDLISGSQHLMHSELVRCFISAVEMLQYLGNNSAFEIEGVSLTYTPTTDTLPWRPWHHVYSSCKAGKNQLHNPQVNQMGKYIVRLFWMGSWRKIYIDDKMPLDKSGKILLPSYVLPIIVPPPPPKPEIPSKKGKDKKKGKKDKGSKKSKSSKGSKKSKKSKKSSKKSKGSKKSGKSIDIAIKGPDTIELWPYLLAKAIFKVASLTWHGEKEIVDFDVVQCLTGWFPQKICTIGLSYVDIWEICSAYSNKFSWADDKKRVGSASSKGSKKSKKSKKSGKDKKSAKSKKSDKSKSGKSKKSSKSKKSEADEEEDDDGIVMNHVIACCNDLRTFTQDEIIDISPCWSHYFLIDQTRDIPLVQPEPWPELPFWKTFRWTDWAVRHGELPEKVDMDNIKCLKIVSSFRKDSVKGPPSQHSIEIKKNVEVLENAEIEEKEKGKKKGKDKKEKKEKKKGGKVVEIPDPSVWIDYRKICEEINTVIIYFKPSRHLIKYKISDIALTSGKAGSPVKGKGSKKSPLDWKCITYHSYLKEIGSESLYGFMDSIDNKYLVFNLTQIGKSPVLEKEKVDKNVEEETGPENDDSCYQFIMAMKKRLPQKKEVVCDKIKQYPEEAEAPEAYLVVQRYIWQKDKGGPLLLSFQTLGSKSAILELPTGRHIFKIWIKSDTPYICYILSDTPLAVGNSEEILVSMTSESHRLQKFAQNISINYGKLVQAFGRPEFREQLLLFHSSYKTDNYLPKKELNTIHDYMYDNLIEAVRTYMDKSLHKNVLRALNIFFRKIYFQPTYRFCKALEYLPEEDVDLYKLMENSTVKIQAFFKGIYVRSILKRHLPEHREHLNIFDLCKKVYTANFSSKNIVNIGSAILRKFFFNPDLSTITPKYELFEDLLSVISIIDFKGALSMDENSWAVVCRYVFYVNCPDPLLIKIKFFLDRGKYMLRVFNNDTREELESLTCNVTVNTYESNVNGYTILCYGYSNESGKHFWRLMLVTLKTQVEKPIIITPVSLNTIHITDNYVPNSKNRIFKFFVGIQDSVVATFRVTTSHSRVNIKLKLFSAEKELIQEVKGVGKVILPVVLLEPNEKPLEMPRTESLTSENKRRRSRGSMGSLKKSSEKGSRISVGSRRQSSRIEKIPSNAQRQTNYILEAFVSKNSWPLSRSEWINIDNIKKQQILWPGFINELDNSSSRDSSRKIPESARKKSIQRTSFGIPKEKPLWVLEVVHNVGDNITVNKDLSEEERAKTMKRNWWKDDPDRYEKGLANREGFIEAMISKAEIKEVDDDGSETSIIPIFIQKSISQANMQRSVLTCNVVQSAISERFTHIEKTYSAYASMLGLFGSMNDADGDVQEEGLTNANPFMLTDMFPPFNLKDYMDEAPDDTDEFDRNVMSQEDFQNEQEKLLNATDEFWEKQSEFVEEMNELTEQQIAKYDLLNEWYFEGVREESAEMMEEVYKERQKYIDDTKKRILFLRELEREKAELEKKKSPRKDKKKKGKDKKSKKK